MSTGTGTAPEGTGTAEGGTGSSEKQGENFTPEEAVAEIERLRTENGTLKTENTRWKGTSRTNERKVTQLTQQLAKVSGTGGAPGGDGGTGGQQQQAPDTSDADLRAMRLEVALDKGLPKSLALRLRGDTQEEAEEDADELLKLVKAPEEPKFKGGADGGTGGPAPKDKSPDFGDWVRQQAGITAGR